VAAGSETGSLTSRRAGSSAFSGSGVNLRAVIRLTGDPKGLAELEGVGVSGHSRSAVNPAYFGVSGEGADVEMVRNGLAVVLGGALPDCNAANSATVRLNQGGSYE